MTLKIKPMLPENFFWGTFCSFIRNVKRGSSFTRSELKEACKIPLGKRSSSEITMDNYRNYLTQAGYLHKSGRGVYRKAKQIPSSFTVTQVLKEAYPHRYKKAAKRK